MANITFVNKHRSLTQDVFSFEDEMDFGDAGIFSQTLNETVIVADTLTKVTARILSETVNREYYPTMLTMLLTASSTTDASSYTISAQNLGAASAHRHIIVVVHTRKTGAATPLT